MDQYLLFAKEIARGSGEILLKEYGKSTVVDIIDEEHKGIITNADILSDKYIRIVKKVSDEKEKKKFLGRARKLFFFNRNLFSSKRNLFSLKRNFLRVKEICSREKKIVF